jgi:molybdate/tungstate transport system substrate-binding protein
LRRSLVACAAIVGVGCGGVASQPAASPSLLIHGSGTVRVMYAGSLVSLFEKKIGPAYDAATGFTFEGEAKGSQAIANNIKDKVRTPDVFVSADPAVDRSLQGPTNGNYVSWWVDFARTEMVIGWSPKSRFAPDFESARSGKRSWESVLQQPGLRLGRTDPELDPKGYRTLFVFQLVERERPADAGLTQRVLGNAGNTTQIFPEEQLVARLQAGELDAGIFYTIEAIEAGLPYLTLPSSINLGDAAQGARYATASFTNKKGQLIQGSPILYTATVPSTVTNDEGAISFVQFLLGKSGQSLLGKEGLLSTPPLVGGDGSALPAAIKQLVRAG